MGRTELWSTKLTFCMIWLLSLSQLYVSGRADTSPTALQSASLDVVSTSTFLSSASPSTSSVPFTPESVYGSNSLANSSSHPVSVAEERAICTNRKNWQPARKAISSSDCRKLLGIFEEMVQQMKEWRWAEVEFYDIDVGSRTGSHFPKLVLPVKFAQGMCVHSDVVR